MLGAVRATATGAGLAAARLRRLAALLAVLAVLVAVRGPGCGDPMAAGTPAMPMTPMTMSMAVGEPATDSAAPSDAGVAPTPVELCPATAAGRSSTDLGSCLQAPPAAVSVTAAVTLAAAAPSGYAPAPPPAPPVFVAAVLRYAATLHQLGLLRT